MKQYAILTDGGADLTVKMVEDWGVKVTPMGAMVGDTSYLYEPTESQMKNSEFYRRVREGEMSSTSAVNPGAWIDMIEPELKAGLDALVIPFSSGLSASCVNAQSAAEELSEKYPDRKIIVVDSLAAALGHGLFVCRAVEKQADGASIEENAEYLERVRFNVCHYFTVEDLKYLHRGGRVSATSAVVGAALGIKPILYVNNEGKLIPIDKVRGRRKSLLALLDNMERLVVEPENQVVFLGHAECLDEAESLAAEIKKRFNVKDVVIGYIGPISGGHAGPGTMALFFMGKER